MIAIIVFTVMGYALVFAGKLAGEKNPLAQGALIACGLMSTSCAFWASTPEQWHLLCSYTVWVAVVMAVFHLLAGAIIAGSKR